MTKRNALPPYDVVRSLFDYDCDSGILRWRVDRAQMKAGDPAGAARGANGYLQVSINRKLYRVHLVIWLWVTGAEPTGWIDHRDTVKSNNRWDNLREATKSQNQANVGLTVVNASGFKGVSRYRQGEAWGKPWQAAVTKDGRHYHVGHFASAPAAHEAYKIKHAELFGEFSRMT